MRIASSTGPVVCFLKFYIFQLVLVLAVMISKLRFYFAFIIPAILALQAEAVHKQPRWEIQSKFSNFKALDSREHSWNIENRWKGRALQHNWFIGRCPAVKTVPYACAPGATDTSQCIYGKKKVHWTSCKNIFSFMATILQRYIPRHLLTGRWGFSTLPKDAGLHRARKLKLRWSKWSEASEWHIYVRTMCIQ